MKKFLAVLLAISVCLFAASALAESGATPAELQPGEIRVHGYISEAADYYVAVPAEWALVGASSLPEHLDQADDILDDARSLYASLSAENDILFAFSKSGEQLVLNYGPSEGVTSDRLIAEMDDLKRLLASNYPGIQFDENCGAYTLKEVSEILYIGAEYKNNTISQYYVPAGDQIFIFTFVNADKTHEEVVLNTFSLNASKK